MGVTGAIVAQGDHGAWDGGTGGLKRLWGCLALMKVEEVESGKRE